jgi:hypothetical protein
MCRMSEPTGRLAKLVSGLGLRRAISNLRASGVM